VRFPPRFIVRRFEKFKSKRERRQHENAIEWLDAAFDKDLASAKDYETQQGIELVRQFECSEYDDKIQRIDSLELTSRARRCHIDVEDLGLPPEPHSSHWIQGRHGTWFIHPKSLRLLAKAVEEAEHQRAKRRVERSEFWWKLITAIGAVAAAIASALNLYRNWNRP